MIDKNHKTIISIKVPVKGQDGIVRNYGTLYSGTSTPSPAGTLLNDDSKSHLLATIAFTKAVRIDGVDYVAEQVAPSGITGAVLQNIDLVLGPDQATPVLTIPDGLLGLPAPTRVMYRVTVTEKIIVSGIVKENAVYWELIQVTSPK